MEIKFHNDSGSVQFKFSNFKKNYQDTFEAINYELHVNFYIFNIFTALEAEEGDFWQLSNYFERILQGTLKSAMFYPIRDYIKLYFEVYEVEKIIVTGTIYDVTYSGEFNFKFTFSISELPRLIQEIDAVIKS